MPICQSFSLNQKKKKNLFKDTEVFKRKIQPQVGKKCSDCESAVFMQTQTYLTQSP